jgi:hypothetical protein
MFHFYVKHNGGVAHMVEPSLRMREARGSIPRTSKFGLDSCLSFFLLPFPTCRMKCATSVLSA